MGESQKTKKYEEYNKDACSNNVRLQVRRIMYVCIFKRSYIWIKCISWFETINLELYLLSRITFFFVCV